MKRRNQYSSYSVPGAFDVLGLAMGNNSSLTVNSIAPWRKGEYFRRELSVNNGSVAVWQAVSVAATGESTVTGNVFVPRTPEAFTYDADGNLTQDGRWNYTWDAENRLVKMESRSDAPSLSKYKLEFVYDSKGRRIQKLVSTNNGSVYVAQSTNRFVYGGWNLVAILNPQSSLLQSFLWGLDLSGTLQGAGGVGGLLAVNSAANGVHFCAYDGNGNVAALVKGTDGTVTASYEYGPFGENLRITGAMGKVNPFRFSTKYQDDESDFLYYGYRSYNPSSGRWLSRDPIEEEGGLNLNGFVGNSPQDFIDTDGLSIVRNSPPVIIITPHSDGRMQCRDSNGRYSVGQPPRLPPSSPNPRVPRTGPYQPPNAPHPIRIPPSAPGCTGETSACGAAEGLQMAAGLFAAVLEQWQLNQFIADGLKNCLAQAKKKGGCGGCCVINLYLVTGKCDSCRNLFYSSSQFYSKPCFVVQADMAAMTGPSIGPDFRRTEYDRNRIYRLINPNAPDADRMHVIDNQTPVPQFRTVCPQ